VRKRCDFFYLPCISCSAVSLLLFRIQKRFPSVLFAASGIGTYILAEEVRKHLDSVS
jgi:hypothetical protein